MPISDARSQASQRSWFFHSFPSYRYNKNLVPATSCPGSGKIILKPEYKGKKFRPTFAPPNRRPVPAGVGRRWNFARSGGARTDWVRGGSRTVTAITAGEIPDDPVQLSHNQRAQGKDPTGNLQYVALEPVPVRQSGKGRSRPAHQHLTPRNMALNGCDPEAQKLADDTSHSSSSIYIRRRRSRAGNYAQETLNSNLGDHQHIDQGVESLGGLRLSQWKNQNEKSEIRSQRSDRRSRLLISADRSADD